MRVGFILPPPPHLAHLDFNTSQNWMCLDPATRPSYLHRLWNSLSSLSSLPHSPPPEAWGSQPSMKQGSIRDRGQEEGKGISISLGYFQTVIINMLELK